MFDSVTTQSTFGDLRLTTDGSFKKQKSNLFLKFDSKIATSNKDCSYIIYFEREGLTETLTIDVSDTATVSDAIEEVLEKLGNTPCPKTSYELYMVKKNGKPKLEYPSFQSDQLLKKTGTTGFALVKRTIERVASAGSSYNNSLSDLNSPPRSLREIPVKKTKKRSWFFSMFNCGACQE